MPYVLIEESKLKEFDPEGKLKTLPDNTAEKLEGLENKANELLGEKKSLQLKFDEHKLESKKKISELHEGKGGGEDVAAIQAKLDDALSKNKDWEGKYDGLVQEGIQNKINTKAAELASSLTKDPSKASLLREQLKSRLTIDGDSFGVLDDTGKPTISTVEELTGQVRTKYPFLVDGSQASGGGAQGNAGSAGKTYKKFSEYGGAELSEIRRETPEVYDRLLAEHKAIN